MLVVAVGERTVNVLGGIAAVAFGNGVSDFWLSRLWTIRISTGRLEDE